MRNLIRLAVAAVSLLLASAGAFAMGSKEKKTEPSTKGANTATGTTSSTGAERSEIGAQSSGLPTGQGTTTADAAKQRGEEKKGGTTDDNLGRQRPDEKSKK